MIWDKTLSLPTAEMDSQELKTSLTKLGVWGTLFFTPPWIMTLLVVWNSVIVILPKGVANL